MIHTGSAANEMNALAKAPTTFSNDCKSSGEVAMTLARTTTTTDRDTANQFIGTRIVVSGAATDLANLDGHKLPNGKHAEINAERGTARDRHKCSDHKGVVLIWLHAYDQVVMLAVFNSESQEPKN